MDIGAVDPRRLLFEDSGAHPSPVALRRVDQQSFDRARSSEPARLDRHDPAADTAAPSPTRVVPLVFDGCFGWLHAADPGPSSDTVVVICPGLSRDALNGHRSLRLLADGFAAAGYPALRFDYPGAGDSRDLDGAEPWAAWQRGIHAACDLARARAGARRVVLCGLRLGALLAAEVASRRDDVAGLVLLAPVVRGKAYVRQLMVEARLRVFASEPSDGGLELDDLRFSSETVALISRADMRRIRLPVGCKVAISERPRSATLTECVEAWSGQGLDPAYQISTDLSALVRATFLNDEPAADYAEVLAWLRAAVPAEAARAVPDATGTAAELRVPGGVETPVRFGPRGDLFGMLCRPEGAADTGLAVVIGNTGGDPHYGFARFSVELARFLAAAGIASLRIDFAGLGDSIGGGAGDTASHIFDSDRAPDFSAAIDTLEQRGYRRFAAMGLCSGAYHAFRASLRERRIGDLVLINIPVFKWRRGDSIEYVSRKAMRSPMYYLMSVLRREAWTRLLRGEVDVLGIAWAQSARFKEHSAEFLRRAVRRIGLRSPPNFARGSLETLSARGARTLFLLAEGDASVPEFEKYCGTGGTELGDLPGIVVRIEPGLDHMITNTRMRRHAAAIILRFLKRESLPEPMRT